MRGLFEIADINQCNRFAGVIGGLSSDLHDFLGERQRLRDDGLLVCRAYQKSTEPDMEGLLTGELLYKEEVNSSGRVEALVKSFRFLKLLQGESAERIIEFFCPEDKEGLLEALLAAPQQAGSYYPRAYSCSSCRFELDGEGDRTPHIESASGFVIWVCEGRSFELTDKILHTENPAEVFDSNNGSKTPEFHVLLDLTEDILGYRLLLPRDPRITPYPGVTGSIMLNGVMYNRDLMD